MKENIDYKVKKHQTSSWSNSGKKFYIAGTGVISPVGGNTAMTFAAIDADISVYNASYFTTQDDEKITMARVPDELIATFEGEFDYGSCFNSRYDRVTKMAVLALRQACAGASTEDAVPLLLAMPEEQADSDGSASFIGNIAANLAPWVKAELSRSMRSGRASGLEALDFAFEYLHSAKYPYILLGGSDSYEDASRLIPLERDGRLLTPGATDAFAPGEAASFLLLSPHIEMAEQRNGQVVALAAPGIADEVGHLFSKEPYRGDGLDQAFKKALGNQAGNTIDTIYSSMNGENFWAKEYGVASMRNRRFFKELVSVKHPADCYGDLGAATSTTLIALAAENLLNNSNAQAHLVYSSSDTAKRGAVVLEKLNVAV